MVTDDIREFRFEVGDGKVDRLVLEKRLQVLQTSREVQQSRLELGIASGGEGLETEGRDEYGLRRGQRIGQRPECAS